MAVKDSSMSGSRSGSSTSDGSNASGSDKDVEKSQKPSENIPLLVKSSDNLRVLSIFQRLSYGVGHVLNDLTASMWFSYMVVFLHQVNNFDNFLTGILMLIGQVSDAIFTPFIGFESDRTEGIKKIGKRKTWHLVGTICVVASFPFLFTDCITCSNAPNIAQFVYFAPFVVIFQFGWASTQISHLSFSSDFTPHRQERVALQSIRNMFAVIANLSVYGIFSLLLYLQGTSDPDFSGSDTQSTNDLGKGDAPKFQTLAFICIGIGIVTNFIFHLGTKEKSGNGQTNRSSDIQRGENSIEQSSLLHVRMKWKDWLKEHQFYQIAVVYMAARVYINVSQVYFPMYITETIYLDKKSIALLPLVTYCSSFLTSFLASYINKFLGRKVSYVVAVVIGGSSCLWMYFVPKSSDHVYGCAVLMGAAGSLLLITSLSMTSDLISANTESSAFVFGAMSFTDKLSNGIALFVIQKLHPCSGCCPACEYYYRDVQVFVPGGALLIGLIALLTLIPQDIGSRVRAVDVLKVMENHARGIVRSPSSLSNSLQCTCGTFYIPPSTCPACGIINYQTHNAQVHRQFDTDDDSDESNRFRETRSLLGSNVNDMRFVTEYGNFHES